MHVHRFEPAYLPGLRALVNNHLSTVVPGWAMTDEAVAAHLSRDPGEYVTDPWVTERATLLVTEGWAVLAAAHLLRYGEGEEVGEHFRGAGEIGWLLSVPGRSEATAAVLSEAREALADRARGALATPGGLRPHRGLRGRERRGGRGGSLLPTVRVGSAWQVDPVLGGRMNTAVTRGTSGAARAGWLRPISWVHAPGGVERSSGQGPHETAPASVRGFFQPPFCEGWMLRLKRKMLVGS